MKNHPGDKLGLNDGQGNATVGVRANGDWCYAGGDTPAKKVNPPLCAECKAVRFKNGCPQCGS